VVLVVSQVMVVLLLLVQATALLKLPQVMLALVVLGCAEEIMAVSPPLALVVSVAAILTTVTVVVAIVMWR
jgi:hypothetical protein